MTDPGPPGAVPLSWEVRARALGGSDSIGDVHRCDLYLADLQTSSIFRTKKARGLGKLLCTGRVPLTDFLSIGQQKEIAPSLDTKSIRKGLKPLPITQVDKVRWHGWPHQPA